ncbi:hypothetical protein JHL21_03430 [Devosia sp. WQ 349]|uniref:hypothetical protein n=1 Tax=Devosia sp. WQ 349K1 TaxID=2800329 RepID=UPI0019064308|nr:hypothetical protein [Devosia sp. WQ 349K1]MBK1793543.1 hypothetical protein [Devosia sp. WQ 349K1]
MITDTPKYEPTLQDLFAAFEAADGTAEALEWLADNDIGPPPIPTKLLCVEAGAFVSGTPNSLVFPVIKDGETIDFLAIDLEDCRYRTLLGWPEWLGADNLGAEVVRLHFSPLEWLEAGCAGVVQIHPFARAHFAALQGSSVIECADIELALEAWDFGFSGRDAELARFEIDAPKECIDYYFERCAYWRIRGLEFEKRFAALGAYA